MAQLSTSEVSADARLTRLLAECQLQPSDIITLDDVLKKGETQSGLVADNTRMFLVNQNRLEGRMGENYSKNIIGCIDNHEEQNYVPKETGLEPRIVGKAAASTSLVVNHAREGDSNRQDWDPQVAKLGLGAILVESENMQNASKATKDDESAVEFLLSKISGSSNGSSFDRSSFYQTMMGQKSTGGTREPIQETRPMETYAAPIPVQSTPVTGADGQQLPILLEQGFQIYPSSSGAAVGISTVNYSLKELINISERDIAHAAAAATLTSSGANDAPTTAAEGATGEVLSGSPFTAAVRKVALKQQCPIYGLLTSSTVGREVFLWVLEPQLGHAIPRFYSTFGEPLGLSTWDGQNDEIVKEAGMYDGLMKVYWVGAKEATAEVIAGMMGEAAGIR